MIINELLIIAGFIFVIWFYIDTKKSLEKIPDESTPPVPYIPPAPIQAPPPVPVITPAPIPTEPAPAAAVINRQQLERAARDCLTLSGCKFDTYSYCRMKSDNELMDIIKDYNFNR